MSQRSNCFKVHPEQEPGPCCNCGQEDISKRYVHLIHKKSENPGFCNFIKENYKISDLLCICRKCELKFKRIFAGTSEDIQGPSLSKKTCTIEKNISNEKASCFLHQFSKCDKTADHTTTVDPGIFQKVFDINLEHLQDTLQVSLCHIHYNTLSNWKREQVCIVCEKISRTKRFICISDCTNDLFLQYLKQELNFEAELNISEKMNGADLLSSLHTMTVNFYSTLNEKNEEVTKLIYNNKKLISEKNTKMTNHEILDKAVQILRTFVKQYTSEKSLLTELPDIKNFDPGSEILNIPPVLWNFLFRISATIKEDRDWLQYVGAWDRHYIEQPFNVCRTFPRLFISSCIFNTQNSQCVKPLHLLLTDVADKFSNSSSAFLSINARIGAGISKDSLRRFITSRCKELEQTNRFISPHRFTIASFDNLDKNQSYSVVGSGKDKSGFHGTTIQTATPCPSLPTTVDISVNIDSFSDEMVVDSSRDRSIPINIITAITNPNDNIGLPSSISENRFSHLTLSDFDCSSNESKSYIKFKEDMNRYGFTKFYLQEKHISVPGVKTFFSLPTQDTEKSSFTSIAVLDETADKKETVLQVLNILHEKFQIGNQYDYAVVVGDGKSYDYLIKLKKEYGASLNWVLPYPGDWHILKNLLPIFIKVYLDVGLKQLASRFHHGSTFRILTECSKFSVTHRFLPQVWEAILKLQISKFLSGSQNFTQYQESYNDNISDILSSLDVHVPLDQNLYDMLADFNAWREQEILKSQTFSFWDSFVHEDFMNYLGLYFAIRTRDWDLRNACLKQLACLFHTFDKHNYLRMIPYHIADLKTYPPEVIQFFAKGCFSVSISGEHGYSVALDEAHGMEINLKTKHALNSFSQSSLAALT
ncbi:unnamed protein product [Mytilus coruscus]|uniref:DUF6589 domain-containing protein n=1 Tax=Mytilus coruscus TaxID=42192 RepID=A0A6J8AZY9_MYTCO|nr:unnamed protein product [Mytilus coruscus]